MAAKHLSGFSCGGVEMASPVALLPLSSGYECGTEKVPVLQ